MRALVPVVVLFLLADSGLPGQEDLKGAATRLAGKDEEARRRAAEILLAAGAEAVQLLAPLLARMDDDGAPLPEAEAAAKILARLEERAVGALPAAREALPDADAAWSLLLVRLVGEVGPYAPTEQRQQADLALQSVVADDLTLRRAVRRARGRLRVSPDAALDDLIGLLRDKDVYLREAAARQIARRGPVAAVALPQLEVVLARPGLPRVESEVLGPGRRIQRRPDHEPFFIALCEATARVAPDRELQPRTCMWLLQSRSPELRARAAADAGNAAPRERVLIRYLIAALSDPEPAVVRAAIPSLAAFGGDAEDAVPRLRELVKGDDPESARLANQALLHIEKDR